METEFLKKEKVAADTYSFFFKKPDNFAFKAGQYLELRIYSAESDNRGNERPFTIASSPTENDLMITSKIGQSSFKKFIEKMPERTKVNIAGPYGTFTLDEDNKNQHAFLA